MAQRKTNNAPWVPTPLRMLKLAMVVAIGYAIFLGARALYEKSAFFPVTQVEVVGNGYLAHSDILALAQVDFTASLNEIDTKVIADRLLQNPYISGVSVTTLLPSKVLISIEERQPVFYLLDQGLFMVDRQLTLLEKLPGMSFEQVPLVTGLKRQQVEEDSTRLREALKLVGKMDELNREFKGNLRPLVSEISLKNSSNPELVLVKGGARVQLGSSDHYQRLYTLGEFMLGKAKKIQELSNIKRIDLTVPSRVIVQKRS